MGNPFLDDFPELVKLDNRDCMDHSVAEAIRTVQTIGQQQYAEYRKEVIIERTKSIHYPIKKRSTTVQKAKFQAKLQTEDRVCPAE